MKQIGKNDKARWSIAAGILFAAVLIAVGVLFCIYPDDSVRIVCYVLGALLIAGGVGALIAFFVGGMSTTGNRLVIGVTLICVGILFLVRRELTAEIVSMLCGVMLMIDGLFKLQQAISCARRRLQIWVAYLVLAIVYLIYGIVILASSRALGVLIGVGLIIEGACNLVFFLVHAFAERKVKAKVREIPNEEQAPQEGQNGED